MSCEIIESFGEPVRIYGYCAGSVTPDAIFTLNDAGYIVRESTQRCLTMREGEELIVEAERAAKAYREERKGVLTVG